MERSIVHFRNGLQSAASYKEGDEISLEKKDVKFNKKKMVIQILPKTLRKPILEFRVDRYYGDEVKGRIKADGVVEMLGVPQQQQVFSLLEGIVSKDAGGVIKLVNSISEHAPDFVHTLDSLLSVLHRLAIAQVLPGATDNSYGDKEQIEELASKFTAEDIQLYYQLGLKGRDDLRFAGDMKSTFEMILLRMLVFSPGYVGSTKKASPNADATGGAEIQIKKKPPKKASDTKPKAVQKDLEQQIEVLPIGSLSEPNLAAAGATPTNSLGNLKDLNHASWLELYSHIGIDGIAANVLANSELNKVENNTMYFVLDEKQSSVFNKELLPRISMAVIDFFNKELEVLIDIGEITKETPAKLSQRLKQECHREMISDFEKDKNVQQLLKHFSGTLAKETITPITDQDN